MLISVCKIATVFYQPIKSLKSKWKIPLHLTSRPHLHHWLTALPNGWMSLYVSALFKFRHFEKWYTFVIAGWFAMPYRDFILICFVYIIHNVNSKWHAGWSKSGSPSLASWRCINLRCYPVLPRLLVGDKLTLSETFSKIKRKNKV